MKAGEVAPAVSSSGKRVALGVLFTLVVNVLFNTTSFTIRFGTVSSGEVCFVKGIVQILVWGSIIACVYAKNSTLNIPSRSEDRFLWVYVAVFGVASGVMTIAGFVAVKMIPVSDVVVIAFTYPAFTLVLSACVLGTSITVPKVLLCVTLVTGVALAVKPKFLFSEGTDTVASVSQTEIEYFYMPANDSNVVYVGTTTANETGVSEQEIYDATDYAVGVSTALLCGICNSVVNVCSARSKACPGVVLALAAGISTVIVALPCPLMGIQNRIFTDISSIRATDWAMIWGLSAATTVGGLLLIAAARLCPPTVVGMVRATEILLAMAVEAAFFAVCPGPLSAAGSALVVASVVGMIFVDDIQKWVARSCGCDRRKNANEKEDLDRKDDGPEKDALIEETHAI